MSRFAPSVVSLRLGAAVARVSLAVALPAAVLLPSLAFAQAPTADPLAQSVEDFWHFGKVARYDVAAAKADEIIKSGAEPVKIAQAFEKVAASRGDNLDDWLIRWQGVEAIKAPAAQIADLINKGRYTRRADPSAIEANIARLNGGDRPYRLAMAQLRESGEMSVPPMLAALRDPNRQAEYGAIRRGLIDLGRVGLNPLVAATMSTDPALVEVVVGVLGELGYDSAAPYLARLSENSMTPGIKTAADNALARIGGQRGKAGDLFYDLAERQYYGKSSLVADQRFPMANVWKFDGERGLQRTPVPPAIFNDIMTLQQAEMAMSLGTSKDALSLWLAGDFKREADLPEGAKDETRPANNPDAHFFGVTAGSQYLNAALARARNDKNNAVALSTVKALQEIVGDANFKSAGQSPLIDAMQSPDRRVRFEAAFTLAAALPQSGFAGQELVVPLLAEAISQTGQPSVLVVLPTQDAVNGLVQPMKADGFIANGATNAAGAVQAAANVPSVDVVIFSEELPPVEAESLLGLISRTPKLRSAAKLVITKSAASPWETRKASDPTISTTTATDAKALKDVVGTAREATGALPLDAAMATQYATRAGELIKRLAISRGQVLDLTPARGTLLGALEDARPEIVKLAGEGLALLNNEDAQRGVLARATADGVADDVKVSLFKSLAVSAKFFGNKLDASQAEQLDGVVTGAASAEVKSAAAEARGALNLPSDQARKLILANVAK